VNNINSNWNHSPNPSSRTKGTLRQSSLKVISSGWLWCTENRLCRSKSLKHRMQQRYTTEKRHILIIDYQKLQKLQQPTDPGKRTAYRSVLSNWTW